MELRELVGYAFLVLAVMIAAVGIWAVRYFSPMARYGRMRAKERRQARERQRNQAK